MDPGAQRTILVGKPDERFTNNAVHTGKYNPWNFLPISIGEQFRRNGNLYFLVMGCLMFLGTYTALFDSSVSPWTTLGPLAAVIAISLTQEGAADLKRHRSDRMTNDHPCVVVRLSNDLEGVDGKPRERERSILGGEEIIVKLLRNLPGYLGHGVLRSASLEENASMDSVEGQKPTTNSNRVRICFEKIKRMDIRPGDVVVVRNREMIPADIILLGSSGEEGSSYIETSPIDGETNLKLRQSPRLPEGSVLVSSPRGFDNKSYRHPKHESIEDAVKRITRISLLGYPNGVSSLNNKFNRKQEEFVMEPQQSRRASILKTISVSFAKTKSRSMVSRDSQESDSNDYQVPYVATLTSEPPNASVNTYGGKITLPPIGSDQPSIPIALGAENILLRGAVLRNTEWAIGVACFTGSDTKLVRNSIPTPSKFSRLDLLMNRTVILILFIMLTCVLIISILAYVTQSNDIESLWYIGFNTDTSEKWPYLPDSMEVPEWTSNTPYVIQYVFTFITLLNNFVPLSLYVTVEVTTLFMMCLIGWDNRMYHKETDTPAMARSTNVTDLGQVKYVFSDKTGTLTQNVMGFKRCSVDGMIFGAPVEKVSPATDPNEDEKKTNLLSQPFHPLRQLLVGTVNVPHLTPEKKRGRAEELSMEVGLDSGSPRAAALSPKSGGKNGTMTFNAEMFLRVMSICHTVVVEKEIDATTIDAEETNGNRGRSDSGGRKGPLGFFRRKNSDGNQNGTGDKELETLDETKSLDETNGHYAASLRTSPSSTSATNSNSNSSDLSNDKAEDGSPVGFAYQAESPDEGALVSAASSIYGFQLRARDSNGIQVLSGSPSLLSDSKVSDALKNRTITAKQLAAETAAPKQNNRFAGHVSKLVSNIQAKEGSAIEVWTLLAVNKFDSDRKRMSVLVRSPPELGSIPMLLCKGADSSMIDPDVCEDLDSVSIKPTSSDSDVSYDAAKASKVGTDYDSNVKLGVQAHLGAFASEGLRTLVLGVRILSEAECEEWLESFDSASTAMQNRDFLLTEVAKEIETKLHIVGATAIEDKLQDGVPETIQSIGKAGIKLWVLTGDKRETAIEIGYSTKVLNPKMHVTDVADGDVMRVKALVAMEFLRLVKMGKLREYQRSATNERKEAWYSPIMKCLSALGYMFRRASRACRRFYQKHIRTLGGTVYKKASETSMRSIKEEEVREDPSNRREEVRNLAEQMIQDYLDSPEGESERRRKGISTKEDMIDNDEVPGVFFRAASARASLGMQKSMNENSLRDVAIVSLTSEEVAASDRVVEEDLMSIESFVPGQGHDNSFFDKKKRSLLERLFAVDRDVRKGLLVKHLVKEKKQELRSNFDILRQSSPREQDDNIERQRGLVIEGSALVHFLGDPVREELLFSVASNCESVIACRVSPKQKALLVNLVRQFIVPSPVTLAIGDGANDVGMIQEAEVGVGISGLEGQQAVNASDFSIAQFRFLEELLLIHGRWNFMRLSKVVLFSFYKNSLLATLLILYSPHTYYSGTPLFDMWALSAFNFVCTFPILFYGFFDQDIKRDYVKKNPQLYSSGANNEYLSLRVTLRWVSLVVIHANVIFFLSSYAYNAGGSISPALNSSPGDGDGGDMKVFGTTIFTILNWMLTYKVLYEGGSIIHGTCPPVSCNKQEKDGLASRLPWTWVGAIILSIGINFLFLYIYQEIGKGEIKTNMSGFTMVTSHMLSMRPGTWIILLMVSIAAMIVDVIGKVYSNMFYPSQAQIHKEISVLNRTPNNQKVSIESYTV